MKAPSAFRRVASRRYLDVRYTADRRPFTDYPEKLCAYLTRRFLSDLGPGRRLLDLGSGRGDFLHAFSKCGWSVLGLDNSLSSERSFPDPLVAGEIGSSFLPFRSGTFDVVFNKSVIEHIADTDLFLEECLRVLRPGGRTIILTPDWRAQYRHFYDDYTHVQPFTQMGLEDAVKAHGFRIRESLRFRQLPFVWKWPILHLYCDLLTLLPDGWKKRFKTIRFAKEWMLLVVAERPEAG